ncbi:MAG: hypothetical protein QOE22_650 [Candidatus Parcubacteria bacterium]|nr:hypothetical protein [Candidatus Parcubacteria bacterium]
MIVAQEAIGRAVMPMPGRSRPKRKRYSSGTKSTILVFDQAIGAPVRRNVLDVLDEMLLLYRKEESSYLEIAARFRLRRAFVTSLFALRRLVPAVRKMLAASTRYVDRLSLIEARYISGLRPKLQAKVAARVLSGELSLKDLGDLLRDPKNKAPHKKISQGRRSRKVPYDLMRRAHRKIAALEREADALAEVMGAISQLKPANSHDAQQLLEGIRLRVRMKFESLGAE